MDLDFLKLLMDKTGFPEEAKKEALRQIYWIGKLLFFIDIKLSLPFSPIQ